MSERGCVLSQFDGSVRYFEVQRAVRNVLEQGRFRSGQPDLASPFRKLVEKRRPALWIEVGSNLVEQQDRPLFALFGNQVGMGQYDGKEQRFLFAGGAFVG